MGLRAMFRVRHCLTPRAGAQVRGHSLDELIADQLSPFPRDPNDLLGDFWPEEESIDDFLDALREWTPNGLIGCGSF
jgi:hypothetical protein